MINSGVLSFDGTGRIRTRNGSPPNAFNGGTPIIVIAVSVNLLAGNNVAPDAYLGGLPYFRDGQLCITAIGSVVSYVAGIPISTTGEVAGDTASAITFYNNGLPMCANQKLAIAVPE